LECDVDCGGGAGGDDDGRCGGDDGRGEHWFAVHGDACAGNHAAVAHVGTDRIFHHDHGNEFRCDAGKEHCDVQRNCGDVDHELECDVDCGGGSGRRNDGKCDRHSG